MLVPFLLVLAGCGLIFLGCWKNRRQEPEGAAIAFLGFLLAFMSVLIYAIIN